MLHYKDFFGLGAETGARSFACEIRNEPEDDGCFTVCGALGFVSSAHLTPGKLRVLGEEIIELTKSYE